jgi:hypothetical protein
MADYHPLIARAVEGLDRNTGENRRVLYERARAALVAQLRSITPALNESDITRERLALEDAIRRVEAEAAKRARDGEEPRPAPEPPAMRPSGPSLTDQGLKGFRDTIAEAEGLGEASAQASQAARDVYESASHESQRDTHDKAHDEPRDEPLERSPPRFEPRFEAPPRRAPEPEHDTEPEPPAEDEHDTPPREPDVADTLPPPPPPPRHDDLDDTFAAPRRSYRGLIRAIVILLVIAGLAGAGYWQRNTITALIASLRSTTTTTTPPTTTTRNDTAPATQQKIPDRVAPSETPGVGRPATAPAAEVAQKVVLYDEDPNDPKGKRYVGSAVWKTETVSPGPGLAPELAIRADVEIPERHMRMTWSLRRNTDKALPASHTIEIMFTLPADFAEGGIQNVPGVLMKPDEQSRGVPLAGLAVKVTNGFFLIGLSSVEVDKQRNIQLLKERSWFDIPLVYNTGKRAILAMEKGSPGERVFEEAFRAWGE